jgi:hypothetical protein
LSVHDIAEACHVFQDRATLLKERLDEVHGMKAQ